MAVVSVNDFKADPSNFHQCLRGPGRKLQWIDGISMKNSLRESFPSPSLSFSHLVLTYLVDAGPSSNKSSASSRVLLSTFM